MMIDRWKACGWRTNKQWRKEIKEWWEITWITLKNNIKIMKSQSYPFWYNLYIECINVYMGYLNLCVVLI